MLLRTLGGLSLSGASFHRPKPLLLLAYLAMEGPTERRYLAELFWLGAANPRQNLSVALSQLKEGAPRAIELNSVTVGSTVESTVECDARLLLAAADARDWVGVLDLYSGPFLQGWNGETGTELEEWLHATREYLESRVLAALLEAAEAELAESRLSTATSMAERAYGVFSRGVECEQRLTDRLYRLLVKLESPHSLGMRRELEMMGVAVVAHEDSAKESVNAPASPSSTARRRTVTVPIGSLIGRDEQLGQLRTLLQGGARLVTVCGLGGMGKTRFASEFVAVEAKGDTFERAYFVELADMEEPREIAGRVAASLRIPRVPRQEAEIAVEHFLRSASTLLVLDNFEQLVEAGDYLLELLAACPLLKIVVTSREPLELRAENILQLEGLALNPATVESRPTPSFAVRLFDERARRVLPNYDLEPHLSEVAEICALLEGSPLCIELAASLVRILPPEELLAQLRTSLDTLSGLDRDIPDRHRTVRALFERSWHLLTGREREVLTAAAVFRGGFVPAGLSAVCGATVGELARLERKSLVRRNGNRLDLHPLVRGYVGEKLEESTLLARELREALVLYVCSLLEWPDTGPRRQPSRHAVDLVLAEYPNVRAAWEWAVENERPDLLERMLEMTYRVLETSGRHAELHQMIDLALDRSAPQSSFSGRLQLVKAHLLIVSRPEEAEAHASSAMATFRLHSDDEGAALGLYWLGTAAAYRGETTQAARLWEHALPRFERMGDGFHVAACMNNLAVSATAVEERERLHERAFEYARRNVPTTFVYELLLSNRAQRLAYSDGDYPQAIRLIEEAIEIERAELERPYNLAKLYRSGAWFHLNLDQVHEAERWLKEASVLTAARSDPPGTRIYPWGARSLAEEAHLHYYRGEIEAARAAAKRYSDAPRGLELLALMAIEEGDAVSARRLLQQYTDVVAKRELPHERSRVQAIHDSLLALIEEDDLAAVKLLLSALRIIQLNSFVPLALDAFVTAARRFPNELTLELAAVARAHPAATYITRMRALRLANVEELVGGSISADNVLGEVERLRRRLRTMRKSLAAPILDPN